MLIRELGSESPPLPEGFRSLSPNSAPFLFLKKLAWSAEGAAFLEPSTCRSLDTQAKPVLHVQQTPEDQPILI